MAGPLTGVKLFDLTVAGVGPWATMILANMGANTIKVEAAERVRPSPRGGDAAVYQGLGTVYMHCHLGKKGMFLDLKTPQGKEIAHRLLGDADLFIENMKWGTVARLGFSYDEVAKINPRIVYGNYPGWGDTGPYKDRGSGDTVTQAFSGPVSISGKKDGEAESLRWYGLHDFNASSYIATTALLGLLYRERAGKGLRMMSPQQSNTIAIQHSRIAEFLSTGENVRRMGSGTTTTVPHKAFLSQDKKWLAVGVVSDEQWRGLCKALKDNDLLKDARFSTNPGRVQHREEVEDRLQAIFKTLPAKWWTIQLRKQKVPVSLFYDYETIPDLPQVKANKYIVPVKYPKLGVLPVGNLPIQFSRTPVAMGEGIWPGQDTERLLKEGWGKDGVAKAKGYFGPKGPTEKGVLDGVTVVDMTQGLCGPYASLLLADSGARVIKVEPPEGDYARGWGPPSVDGVSAVFFHLNRNKEGVRLNIRNKGDRQKLLELLKNADVLIEEEGQARLGRLGLGYGDLEKVNPGLVHCNISPFGAKGPLRDDPASELVLQAMSDFVGDLGVMGEEPVRMGPDMASLGASVFASHGILGALYHKWRTGEGQQVSVSMLGSILFQRGISWISQHDPEEWSGFYCDGHFKAPDTGYKTADGVIVMGGVRSPEQLKALLKGLGMEEYLDHPLFKKPLREIMGFHGSGLAHQAKPIWEAAFKRWKGEELVTFLNNFGSSAAVANGYRELFFHPQGQALDILREANVPQLGPTRFQGPPWRLYGVAPVTPKPYKDKEG